MDGKQPRIEFLSAKGGLWRTGADFVVFGAVDSVPYWLYPIPGIVRHLPIAGTASIIGMFYVPVVLPSTCFAWIMPCHRSIYRRQQLSVYLFGGTERKKGVWSSRTSA